MGDPTVTLFVGDLHAKAWLLPRIQRTAMREHASRMVLLGDYCDDWNISDSGQIAWFETFTAWLDERSRTLEVVPLIGNHDVPYWLQADTATYDMCRRMARGFKPGAQRRVHRMIRSLPLRVAWAEGGVIAMHAGLCANWGERSIDDYDALDAETIADRLNDALERDAWMGWLYREMGFERGGDSPTPSPIWAGRGELLRMADRRFTQIGGHTPVPTVTREGCMWLCDTFSTLPDAATPIGDRTMLVMETAGDGAHSFRVVPMAE